jgi:hypothetical protein
MCWGRLGCSPAAERLSQVQWSLAVKKYTQPEARIPAVLLLVAWPWTPLNNFESQFSHMPNWGSSTYFSGLSWVKDILDKASSNVPGSQTFNQWFLAELLLYYLSLYFHCYITPKCDPPRSIKWQEKLLFKWGNKWQQNFRRMYYSRDVHAEVLEWKVMLYATYFRIIQKELFSWEKGGGMYMCGQRSHCRIFWM